jgi:hypothetical protein
MGPVVAPAAQGTPTTTGTVTPSQVLVTITPTPQPVVLASTCSNSSVPGVVAPAVAAAPLPFPGMALPFPLLGASPLLPFPPLPLPGPLPPILAPPLAPPAPAATNNAPLLSCVNTSVGVALQWTPLRGTSDKVTYGVYRCDRTAVPGQPGCDSVFTTDSPVLFGPVSLGADYIVQATSGNLIVVSNRVPL